MKQKERERREGDGAIDTGEKMGATEKKRDGERQRRQKAVGKRFIRRDGRSGRGDGKRGGRESKREIEGGKWREKGREGKRHGSQMRGR